MSPLRFSATALAALAIAAASTQVRAADWVVADGQLAGIEGLAAGGAVYHLAFRDDSCVALFAGCDRPEKLLADAGASRAIAEALAAEFGALPAAGHGGPAGCTEGTFCELVIPYAMTRTYNDTPFVHGVAVRIVPGAPPWVGRSMAFEPDRSLARLGREVYVVARPDAGSP